MRTTNAVALRFLRYRSQTASLSFSQARLLASYANGEAEPPVGRDWRKQQLDKLERKFQEPLSIENDEELQPMWKDMESRVTRRRAVPIHEAKGKHGRKNIRRTDEDVWLNAGMYDNDDDEDSNESR